MAGTVRKVYQMGFRESILRSRQINYGLLVFNSSRRPDWEPDVNFAFASRTPGDAEYYKDEPKFRPCPQWVSNLAELENLVVVLNSCEEFSVHVRQHRGDSLTTFTTTIQLETWDNRDFLVKACELHDDLKELLKGPLEDGRIVKVFYNFNPQVQALQRNFGIYPYGIADLREFGTSFDANFPPTFKRVCQIYAPDIFPSIEAPPPNALIRYGRGCRANWFVFLVHEVHLLLRIFNNVKALISYDQIRTGFQQSTTVSYVVFTDNNPKQDIWKLSNDMIDRNHWGDIINPGLFGTLYGLMEWRSQVSKNFNLNLQSFISNVHFFKFCTAANPGVTEARNILRNLGRFEQSQANNLVKIVNAVNPLVAASEFKWVLCRNCFKRGHGPALFCIYPRSVYFAALEMFLNRPENIDLKIAYNLKRDAYFQRVQAGAE